MAKPVRPGLDEHFCPSCYSRNLVSVSREEYLGGDTSPVALAEWNECFVDRELLPEVVFYACNDCDYELHAENGGMPTLRDLLRDGVTWGALDIDTAQLMRWAAELSRDQSSGG